jgi:hypothetical protein
MAVLTPKYENNAGMLITFEGAPGPMAQTTIAGDLIIYATTYTSWCAYTLDNIHVLGSIALRRTASSYSHSISLMLRDSYCYSIVADGTDGLSSIDTLDVLVRGTTLTSAVEAYSLYTTSQVGAITAMNGPCVVYAKGTYLYGSCEVSGKCVLEDVCLAAGVSITAESIKLVNSGHVDSASFSTLTATGASHVIEMDSVSFERARYWEAAFAAAANLRAVGGGELAYAYPVTLTSDDSPGQILVWQDLTKLPDNMVVSMRVVVTVYNPGTTTDHGYFERVGVFDKRAGILTLVKGGEVLHTAGPVVGTASAHSVYFEAQGTAAVLLCSPSSSTADLNNSWKAVAYFSVHKAS